jgi:Flp pilus assembly protein TadD
MWAKINAFLPKVCLPAEFRMTIETGSVIKVSRWRAAAGASLLIIAAMALGGCQTTSSADKIITGSTEPASLRATAEAARRWEADPGNSKLGIHYAQLLKGIGQTDKALKVIAEISGRNPQDTGLLALYGKELAAAGRGEQASDVLYKLVAAGKADWKIHSALGTAYDQQGRFKDARDSYREALKEKPGEISVINNLGMSYALEGNLPEAEKILRQAAQEPHGAREPRLRQNLALVVGLQGRFEEAKEIASKDLSAVQVEANMTYLRSMLAQPDPWQQLKPTAKANNG